MIDEIGIDFDENMNWQTISQYAEHLGKPVKETFENYADWQCLGYLAVEGVRFKNLETGVVCVFYPEDFGDIESESLENYKLVLKGDETIKKIDAKMTFFPRTLSL